MAPRTFMHATWLHACYHPHLAPLQTAPAIGSGDHARAAPIPHPSLPISPRTNTLGQRGAACRQAARVDASTHACATAPGPGPGRFLDYSPKSPPFAAMHAPPTGAALCRIASCNVMHAVRGPQPASPRAAPPSARGCPGAPARSTRSEVRGPCHPVATGGLRGRSCVSRRSR